MISNGVCRMKQWSRTKIIKELKEKIPDINSIKKSENFMGKKGGIWVSWVTTRFYKGLPVFDDEAEDYGHVSVSEVIKGNQKLKKMQIETNPLLMKMQMKTLYVDGVYREIYNWLDDRGWYHQWFNSSNLFFWKYDIKGFGV